MLYTVSYDISDDKRRLRLSKTLKNYGNRVQYSVFECILTAQLFDKMFEQIEVIIDPEVDSIRIYPTCAACEKQITIIGQGDVSKLEEVYII